MAHFNSTIIGLHLTILVIVYFSLVTCLYQDQVGKFDWRKQFIGIPKFVYNHPGLGNTIVGTESNVIASLQNKDGDIIWRQLLPKECNLDHMLILKSNDDHRDYLVQTSCKCENGNKTFVWNPHNGLLASETRYKELAEDDQAESVLPDAAHHVGDSTVFKASDSSDLIVSNDGRVTYRTEDGRSIWIREESLALVSAAEIVKLPIDMRDQFGLKKIIVLATQTGKLFGLDTISGDILWELFNAEFSTRGSKVEAILTLNRQSEENQSESRAILIHPKGLILQFNPISGEFVEKKQLPNAIKQISYTEVDDVDGDRGVIIVDTQHKVHIYPSYLEARVKANLDRYFMTIVDRTPASLNGFKFVMINTNDVVPNLIWSLTLNDTESVVSLAIKRLDEEVHSPARVLGDRGILYKYLNPNLIAVMTQANSGSACTPENYINVYLIDAVTGALVHSIYHPKSQGPFNMVHSENWLVYSYYNTKNRRTEVSSLEMFEGTTQSNSTSFSSLTRSSIKPKLVEHKTFIFPSGIEAMTDTITLRGMTNRHIIVALPSGALLEVPKIFLDPRRPINMTIEHREEGLIPYMPELPIPSESIINYDQTLLAVRKITTSPAMLESTSLVLAYGLDLFFTRVTPSKTFDILKDDFDHILISAVLAFLVVASYVSKLLAQRKALHAAWK